MQAVDLAATEPLVLASSLNLLACTLWDRGLLTEARPLRRGSRCRAQPAQGGNTILPMILKNFGIFARDQGNLQEARDAFEAALAALPVTDVSFSHPLLLGNLAQLAWEDGDHPRSASLTLESLELGRTMRNAFVVANTLDMAASMCLRQGGRIRRHASSVPRTGCAGRVGVAIEPQDVAERQALVAQVQQILGEAASTQAWSDGESLSLDQAI